MQAMRPSSKRWSCPRHSCFRDDGDSGCAMLSFRPHRVWLVGLYQTTAVGLSSDGAAHPTPKCVPPAASVGSVAWTLLVYTGSVSRAPPTGFERSPLHRLQPRAFTPPGPEARFGCRLLPRLLVPPSWILTTLTVYTAQNLVGLLHPTADHEVHQVSTSARRCRDRARGFPTDAVPSRVFPTRVAVHVSPRF